MSSSGCSATSAVAGRRFVVCVLAALSLLLAAGLVFYATQNSSDRIGGAIAPQKMLWLFHAIALWVLLPAAIVCDRRMPPAIRRAYAGLLVLMLVRGVAELWMLYVSHDWSPMYGIAHDAICMLVAGWACARLVAAGMIRGAQGWVLLHLAVTGAAFLPEIHFARYMAENFNTVGEAAIYFVPDDPRHADVLRTTAWVVSLLTIYLPVFLWGWLFGPARSKHTARG